MCQFVFTTKNQFRHDAVLPVAADSINPAELKG
jgi:hypothetical protein